jgi:thymidylate synthase
MGGLTFEALYYGERLRLINPTGDVGLIVLWTKMEAAERKLAEIDPALLDPARSRIAVVANLYGDGMYAMFCNLLYNPQIRHLVAIGEPLGQPTTDELQAFLDNGVETTTMLGTEVTRIIGTNRVFPQSADFPADRLRARLSFRWFGKFSHPQAGGDLRGYLEKEPFGPAATEQDRVHVELPQFDAGDYQFRPSDVLSHEVSRAGPLDCWLELVARVGRFGHPVALGGESRLELLNVKVVITAPQTESAEALADYGFDLAAFRAYQRSILQPELPAGLTYTYGNRMRGYTGDSRPPFDGLEAVGRLLAADPQTRRAFVDLWDTNVDLADPGSVPCLTTVFFRAVEGRLELTATYRAHNLLIAWMQNVYGLMAVQQFVAERAGLRTGPITVISHSLGINPGSSRYALSQTIASEWDPGDAGDPNGDFTVIADRSQGLVLVDQTHDGRLVKRYRADRPAKIQREMIGDLAVSDVGTAMWLGGELRRAEDLSRIAVARPEPPSAELAARPSAVHSHAVSRARPVECWRELVTRVVRFGRPVEHADGAISVELPNVKAVITDPTPEAPDSLARFGLGSRPGPDREVHRWRTDSGDGRPAYDVLAAAGARLKTDPTTRHAYISLWDTKRDITAEGPPPRLVTLFFRASDDRLTLTATYRDQDLLDSWMHDVHELIAVQRHVAEHAGMPVGAITVISHALTVDPHSNARTVAEEWRTDEDVDPATGRHVLRTDPNGYFVVSADRENELVVAEHRYDGLLLKQYRADHAGEVRRQIVRDLAVSTVSHAMWVGQELQRAEDMLPAFRSHRE